MSTFLDLNDLHTQSNCLRSLLHVLYEVSTEIQYVLPNGERDGSAERVSSLLILARDECERLDRGIGDAIGGLKRDPEPASDIMALFHQWNDLRDHSNEPGLDEDDVLRRCNETDEVMRQILALPAKSATDLAAKLMCFTHYGDYALDQFAGGERLMWEMASLVGHSEKLADKFLPASTQGARNTEEADSIHPDADLLKVGREFDQVRQAQVTLYQEVGDDESYETIQRIGLSERKISVLSDFILSLEPKTIDGLRVVAKVWVAQHVSTDGAWPPASPHLDERAVHAVMRWLAEGGAS